ncbi:MAG: inositol monophosphatase family protein [Acidimicrobiales bacterium]|jgi:myo-inositol-1(or 4)-monophosphatase
MKLEDTRELAREASQIIYDTCIAAGMGSTSSLVEDSRNKGNRDVVTGTDLAVQDGLKKTLTALIPGSSFQSEEGPSESAGDLAGPNWTVDPVDGTVNYSRGIYPFTSAALLRDGQDPVLGVVVDIQDRSAVIAIQGAGTFRLRGLDLDNVTEDRITVLARPLNETLHSVMVTPKMDERARIDSLGLMAFLLENTLGPRLLVSQAYEARCLAYGGLDSVVSLYSSGGWTSGVAKLLCSESGGIVLDIDPIEPGRKHGFALASCDAVAGLLCQHLEHAGYSVSAVE